MVATSSQAVRGDLIAPEHPSQVFGYWFGPGQDPPAAPVGLPTGALLPALGVTFAADVIVCLDLVPVRNYWLVLSELGRYTYQHTSGLLLGEQWRFAPVREVAGGWPVLFSVAYDEPLSRAEIVDRYGEDAAARARPDACAVQLRLSRVRKQARSRRR